MCSSGLAAARKLGQSSVPPNCGASAARACRGEVCCGGYPFRWGAGQFAAIGHPGRVEDFSAFGLPFHDQIGMDLIMFEVDYPHGDSTWPRTVKLVQDIDLKGGLSEAETFKSARGNAIKCYGLKRSGSVLS